MRNDDVDVVELPSLLTRRDLYAKYVFQRGYRVKAGHKGKLPKMEDYQLREFDDYEWPAGSVPKPICSRFHFDGYWKNNFPKMKICNKCEDTCSECWKYTT